MVTITLKKKWRQREAKDLAVGKSYRFNEWHNVRNPNMDKSMLNCLHANTVFTASYHGLLYSLYFHKNVYYYNREKNQEWSRWEKKLGISNREISGEFKEQPMIDYQYVDNRRRLYAGCKYDNCKQHSS